MMYHVGQNCRKEEASNGIRSRFSRGLTILAWAATLSLLLFGCGGGAGGGGGTVTPVATNYPVSGKVVDANGNGVPNVTVTISSSTPKTAKTAEGAMLQTVQTDAGGTYTFTVPNGTYTINSADTTYGFYLLSVTVAGAPPIVSNITAFPVFTITGEITLAGSLLAGTTVTLFNTSAVPYTINGLSGANVTIGSILTTATSGSDGIYTFTGVRSGSYMITPSSPQYVFKLASLPTLNNSGVVTITDNRIVYLYNPEGTGNQLAGNGTIIYNTQPPYTLTSNAVSGIDFLASVPGGAGN